MCSGLRHHHVEACVPCTVISFPNQRCMNVGEELKVIIDICHKKVPLCSNVVYACAYLSSAESHHQVSDEGVLCLS